MENTKNQLTLTTKHYEISINLNDNEADAMAWLMDNLDDFGRILREIYRERV